ncbi:hypothetical protein ACFQ88_24740 [Paenibacillus sp. NPDC056579]|uniref:hypothetical protein n=1 Tax=Paenibacillus sp. NPDC056579 TaxID=3345871 RepID=UPI0036BE0A2E
MTFYVTADMVLKLQYNNDLNENDQFNSNWSQFTYNEYMPNIHLWGCAMSERYEYSTLLESQIQRALRRNFTIGCHINKPDMSWLGKIEHTHEELSSLRFEFSSYPIVDDCSLSLLKNLTEKRIIKYRKENFPRREKQDLSALKRSRLRKIRKMYSQAYYRWDPIEERILYFLLEKQMPIDEIVKYLKRTPAEIKRRIEKTKEI